MLLVVAGLVLALRIVRLVRKGGDGDEPTYPEPHLMLDAEAGAQQQRVRRRPTGDGMGMAVPEDLKRRVEAVIGRAVDPRVRIHVGQQAAQAAQALEARAFTVGTNIYFGAGEWRPDTPEGFALLVHEVTHTMQHLEGRDRSGKPRARQPETAKGAAAIGRFEPPVADPEKRLPERLRRSMRGLPVLQRKEVRSERNQQRLGRQLGRALGQRIGSDGRRGFGTVTGLAARDMGAGAPGWLRGLAAGFRGDKGEKKAQDSKAAPSGTQHQQLEREAVRNEAKAKTKAASAGEFAFLKPPPKSPISVLLGKDQDKDVEIPRTPENYLKRFMDYFHVRKSMREDEFVDLLAERVMDLLEEEMITDRERRQPQPW